MSFYSVSFLIFFTFFFLFYWLMFNKTTKMQNSFLLVGSYLFYGLWDWRFLLLLASCSLFTYILALLIGREQHSQRRRLYLILGIFASLLPLLIFKYLDFFLISLADVGQYDRLNPSNLILPMGISFYSFRVVSYLLDVDKVKVEPVRDWLVYFNYVAFFPSIVSGPIDRMGLMLPQLRSPRVFDYHLASDGTRQLLWGLFKKLVVADNCAVIVNQAFDEYRTIPSLNLFLSILVYSVQIYADFSGYSDMAIGLAKLIGFRITRNFNAPFFAESIAEFWRRWHISLTSWTTDYIFTPLTIAFRNWGKAGLTLAVLLNFVIIGLWHGANWTFIFFGLIHAAYYLPLIASGHLGTKRKKRNPSLWPSFPQFLRMVGVFLLVSFAFIFFRAASLEHAFNYIKCLATGDWTTVEEFPESTHTLVLFLFVSVMFSVEWVQRNKEHGLQFTTSDKIASAGFSGVFRWVIYVLIVLSVFGFQGNQQDFIYFRF